MKKLGFLCLRRSEPVCIISLIALLTIFAIAVVACITMPLVEKLIVRNHLYWVAGVIFFVVSFLFFLVREQSTKLLKMANYCLCLHCNYKLPDDQACGRCPECGVKYELSNVRDEWRKEYGIPPWDF